MYTYNPFGEDPAEMSFKSAGDRIGRRIKKIREDNYQDITQAMLGDLVGLNANRVQQYENGARTPKYDLIKSFARALGVSPMALIDPDIDTYIGLMYAFFEMEEEYGLLLKEIDGQIYLYFDEGSSTSSSRQVNRNLRIWLEEQKATISRIENASCEAEADILKVDYRMWKRSFPEGVASKSSKELRKAYIDKQIKELQEKRRQLDEEE